MENLQMYINQLEFAEKDMDTIRSYEKNIRLMLEEVGKASDKVLAKDLLQWTQTISSQSTATKIHKINSVKAFYQWMFEADLIEKNPAKMLKAPKLTSQEVRYTPTDEEVELMIAKATNVRNKAIITVLANTGLRFQELADIKLADVINGQRVIKVIGKGNKERRVPLNEECIKAINEYLPKRKDGVDNLFVSNQGSPLENYSLYTMVRNLGKKLGMENWDKFELHMFRRYAISRMYRQGVAPHIITKMMGHSGVAVEQKHYIDIKDEELLNAVC